MATLELLTMGAIQNIAIALACSYVVLVFVTKNYLVPVLAVLSIGSTVTWVLAAGLLMGFKLSVNVAMVIVLIVGLAVDYAVHLTHFCKRLPFEPVACGCADRLIACLHHRQTTKPAFPTWKSSAQCARSSMFTRT